jgi:steroid delta-isomerase-like uncharacterized protein
MNAQDIRELTGRLDGRLSRRVALRTVAAGATLGLLAARPTGRALGQGTPVSAPPLIEEWAAAWSSHDPERLLALFADDAMYEEVAGGLVFQGKEEIGGYIQANLTGFPDVTVTLHSAFAVGDWAAAEWVYAGTFTGPFPGLPEPTGNAVALRGATIYALRGGKIVRNSDYYDLVSFTTQLGVAPAPGGSESATPSTQ